MNGGILKATFRRILPQLIILGVVLLLNFAVFPGFFHIEFQNGRLFGNLIDVLNRGAPIALLVVALVGLVSLELVRSLCTQTASTLLFVTHRPDERDWWLREVGGPRLSLGGTALPDA